VKSQFSDIFPNWNILFLFFCVKTCHGYLSRTAFTVYAIGVTMFSAILSVQTIREMATEKHYLSYISEIERKLADSFPIGLSTLHSSTMTNLDSTGW